MASRRLFEAARAATRLTTALAAAAPLTALAQGLDPTTLREADDDRTDLTYQNLTIDQIEDMNVVRDNTLVGEIEEVLMNDRDEIVAVVIDTAARSPGAFERDVIVPIDQLEFDAQRRQASTRLTADELDALPTWPD